MLPTRVPTAWTVLEHKMAPITSDSDAVRIHDHQMAPITSDSDAVRIHDHQTPRATGAPTLAYGQAGRLFLLPLAT